MKEQQINPIKVINLGVSNEMKKLIAKAKKTEKVL